MSSERVELPRRLPSVPPPLPDEALISWVERVIEHLDVTPVAALRALGLWVDRGPYRPGRSYRSHMYHYAQSVPPEVKERLAAACGLEDEQIEMMTLRRFAGSALGLRDSAKLRPREPGPDFDWLHTKFVSFCPDCLIERQGRWSVWWRLPWVFSCLKHDCFLMWRCPECSQPMLEFDSLFLERHHGRRMGSHSRRRLHERHLPEKCPTGLDGMRAPRLQDGSFAAVQRELNRLCSAEGDHRRSASQSFRDLLAVVIFCFHALAYDDDIRAEQLRRVSPMCAAELERVLGALPIDKSPYAMGKSDLWRIYTRTAHILADAMLIQMAARIVSAEEPFREALGLAALDAPWRQRVANPVITKFGDVMSYGREKELFRLVSRRVRPVFDSLDLAWGKRNIWVGPQLREDGGRPVLDTWNLPDHAAEVAAWQRVRQEQAEGGRG